MPRESGLPQPKPADRLVADDSAFEERIDLRTYSLTAVKKAAYRLADRCTIRLGAADGTTVPLSFLFRPGTTDSLAREAVRGFYQELLDEDLREQLHTQTDALRTLILAHTFSKTDLVQRE